MNELSDYARIVFGERPPDLTVGQMTARAVLIFLYTILLLRIAKKRAFANHSVLDVVLGIILGSVLSRPINGQAELVPTMAAGLVLVLLHWLLSRIALDSHAFGNLVKGYDRVVIRDGAVDRQALRASHVSDHDLFEDLRSTGQVDAIEDVREARLERNGRISVLRKPRVFEVEVAEGVQTMRIEID